MRKPKIPSFKKTIPLLAAAGLACSGAASAASYNYAEALQKSIYFYEAQQSGPIPDWNRNEWRGDSGMTDGSDNGVDLLGGWYDAGDHVKFGFPMAATATMLAWGVVENPEAYSATGQMENIKNNLRFVADYFIKAHTAPHELYGQVGNGSTDHAWWGAAEVMQMDRPSYKIDESCPGSDLAGETAAALAAISMVFADSDPSYSATLLTHSRQLDEFAYDYRGKYSSCITDATGFYNSWSGYNDELVWSAIWLHRATGEASYLDRAKEDYQNLSTENQTTTRSYKWSQAWDDKSYGSYVLMAQLTGDDMYKEDAERWLDYWSTGYNGERITYTPGGLAYLDQWGANRYAANTAFIALIYSDYLKASGGDSTKADTYYDFAESQINYILGDNPRNSSYLIGFGENSPVNPHHRTAHGTWLDSLTLPVNSRHLLTGALVGGPDSSDAYEDDRSNYVNNEVATDYNAGFTSAVARLAMDNSGSVLTNFPVPETRDTEYKVQAKVNSSGSNYIEIAFEAQNMSAWPAKVQDNLRVRYMVDLTEVFDAGYSLSDVNVSTAYSQATSVSDLIHYEGNVYYTEISFAGIDIYPGGQSAYRKEVQVRIAAPQGTSFWDNSNDPSWSSSYGNSYVDAPGMTMLDGNTGEILWGDDIVVVDPCADNCAPTADNAIVAAVSGEPVDIILSASDANGSVDSYDLEAMPSYGSLTGSGANLVYTSDDDYVGTDSFSFSVTDDEGAGSNTATVTINVSPVVVVTPTPTPTPVVTATPDPVVTATPTPVVTATPVPGEGLTCTISKVDHWNDGFVVNDVKVTNNTGAKVSAWEIQLQVGDGVSIVNSWNAYLTQDGNTINALSKVYNATLEPGASASFGFQGSYSGAWVEPICVNDDVVVPTPAPTAVPTVAPTAVPTAVPTVAPTAVPTAVPTVAPTAVPTVAPTAVPTAVPTVAPTAAPTATPTAEPTAEPVESALACILGKADIWPGGVVLNNYAVKNTGTSAISEWSVELDFGNAVNVTNAWNATVETVGDVVVVSGGSLAAGAQASFGFQGAYSGTISEPSCNGEEPVSVPTATPTPTPTGEPTAVPSATPTSVPTSNPVAVTFRVDETGNITKNGDVLPMQCGSWFGLEGQHEPKDAASNPDGAPMELNVGNMWWANGGEGTGRTIQTTMDEIVAQGINVVRLPIAPQTLDETDPQGIGDIRQGGVLKNHESVRQENARQGMIDFIKLAEQNGIDVIVDIHSCSNYLGWRAGRLDAKPPYVDADRIDYDYTREGYSCSSDGVADGVVVQEYNREIWLDNLREVAGLADEIGVSNILGIDIFNEPWDYTWEEWKDLSEAAYGAISEVNDDVLIFVEGIGSGKSDGTEVPHGDDFSNPNWGENFFSFADEPLDIPKDRLVLSPHTYGPSVFVQPMFLDPSQPECEGLEGDAAGEADCNIVIDPTVLRAGWEEHFGYLRDQGYAMVIGEFGGNWNWPQGTSLGVQSLWSHITTDVDGQWQEALVDYMVDKDIQGCYWSINPESADTGGLYLHEYDPVSNTAGWGTWNGLDLTKWDLLYTLWSQY